MTSQVFWCIEKTYILVGHVPVRPLSKWHHLPHDDAVAPHVARRGELPVRDGLWCRPPHRDLPTLKEGEREKGAQFKTSEVRNSSWFAGFYSSSDPNAAAPAIDSPSNSSSTRHMTPPAAKTHTHTWFWHRLSGGSRRCSPFTHRPTSHLASPLPQPCLDKGR